MRKIVIGGQIDKEKLSNVVRNIAGDRASVEIKSDIEAAMEIKLGKADFYLGACNTGGGGALAMAIALLGADKCATISMPGKIKSTEEITEEVKMGKKAFGFTAQHIEQVVPIILHEILK